MLYITSFLSTILFFIFVNTTLAPPSTASDYKSLVSIFLSFTNTISSLLIRMSSQLFYFSVNTCTVPTVTNAAPVPASSVDYDSNVTYTCEEGYSHTAGDLTRSCNADGSLTGTPPVCTSELQ